MSECEAEGCKNKYYARGFCFKHYLRLKRHGDPLYLGNRINPEKHGMKKTPEYKVWCDMKSRCNNIKHKSYPRYGGRGITVCERWINSFTAFLEDMSKRPFPKAQIDRIDNDGNYEPNNCKWATHAENLRHTSRTKLTMTKAIKIRAKYKKGNITQKELGAAFGVAEGTIFSVLNQSRWGDIC